MDSYTIKGFSGNIFENLLYQVSWPLHGEMINRSDNHGNHQINTTIYCDNGELVRVSWADARDDASLMIDHRSEVPGSPGEYELGELTSPLETRCIDARREAEGASR